MSKEARRSAAVNQAITGKALPQKRIRRVNIPDYRSVGYRYRQQIYFELKVEKTLETGWREDVTFLTAGKTYSLSLRVASKKLNDAQKELEISGPFSLFLKPIPQREDLPVICELEEKKRSYTEIFKDQTWEFSIRPESPAGTLKLRLDYMAEDGSQIEGVSSCTLRILSQGTLVDRELIDIYQLDVKLPDNLAVMAVIPYAASQESFKLRGWNSPIMSQEAGFEELIKYEGNINASQLMDKLSSYKAMPTFIWSEILQFSHNSLSDDKASFKKWVTALQRHCVGGLSLIIYDMTKLEIPWELVKLDNSRYLGAEVKVVRGIGPRMGRSGQRLSVQDDLCEGKTLAYFDRSLDEHSTSSERKWLERLTQPYAELHELESELWYAKLKEVGFIYVGGHCMDGSKLFRGEEETLVALLLEQLDTLSWLEGPIVFFNACESGRILYEKVGRRSFAEILLQRCARGFIGTLGKVGNDEASAIAAHMVELALTDEKGAAIAELLRMLRKEVVQDLYALREEYDPSELEREKSIREEYVRRMLYTFMYVYYGNPLTRLRLYPAQKQQEEA